MIVQEFNGTLLRLLDELYSITKNKRMKKYSILIRSTLEDEPSMQTKFIDQFVIHFLEYKPQVLERNKKYFLEKRIENLIYKQEIEDIRELCSTLSEENQNVVFDYLIYMMEFAEAYAVTQFSAS